MNAVEWVAQTDLDVSTKDGAPLIDGERDQIWSDRIATDPIGDMTEPNLDLHCLYFVEDADNYFIGFDVFASDRGMTYGIYLDTGTAE